jgi:site-specific DNA-methyltransferase (adenine-specific)
MLNDIQETNELLEIFNDQTLIWWNQKDLIKLIIKIINKYFNHETNTFNICINFKLSLQSLLDRPKELLELINECLKPKTIEKKQFGEVFTSIKLVNEMLDKLPKEVWTNKNLKWLDPANGMGNFPIIIYLRLMESLKDEIKDENKRKKHILENMIYMCELNKKNVFISKYIFDINNEYKLNLYEGDSLKLDYNQEFNVKTFDIIIGNPPYNEELTNTGAKPLYNKFIEYNLDKCKMLSFIVPSRWFAGGKGLDKFREMMLNRNDIVYINHFDDACKIFGNLINIEGGVNYFLINKSYNDLCNYNGSKLKLNNYDILVENKYYNLIDKLSKYENINNIYQGRYYGIESNDKKLVDNLNNENLIKCYVSQQKGFIKYIDKKYIQPQSGDKAQRAGKKNINIDTYKVITARANGKNSCFGNIFIGYPNEVHTGSYISFKVNSLEEAKSLLSYLKCKLPNFMLLLRKISQDISESTCKWIPLLPLNQEWDDESIYNYFELSNDDINLIKNTKIIGYKDNLIHRLNK